MSEVTQILHAYVDGDSTSTEALFSLVYDELRRLAAAKMASDPRNSLQATALVHEAFLRLVDSDQIQCWNSKAHFFGAAAEAMRRILIDRARKKLSLKRGGKRTKLDLDLAQVITPQADEKMLALDEALKDLQTVDQQAYQIVMLRYFGGLSHQDAAQAMGIGRRAADRIWAAARVWLHQHGGESQSAK